MCFTKIHKQLFDNLRRPLEFETIDCSLWNDKCDYYELSKLTNFNPEGYNLVVLQLNIRGMLSNLSDLRQLIITLDSKGTQVDLILLCETFLNRKTTKLVKILGYEIVTNC